MYCPTCGHRQNSADIRFCSKCGFILTGISQVVHNNGMLPQPKKIRKNTPRSKGIRQGVFIFLLSFLTVPLAFFFSLAVNHPGVFFLTAFLMVAATVLRIGYALLFESDLTPEELESSAIDKYNLPAYGPNNDMPLSFPEISAERHPFSPPGIGKWKDSKDLIKEPAVQPKKTSQL